MARYSKEIASDVAVVTTLISNAYLVGRSESWILVDACSPGNAGKIRRAAEERFGRDACPDAIVLTHGHFDHAGSAPELAQLWKVRVHAHRLEFPYLTGKTSYPPLDPTTPGFFSGLARFFPSRTVNVEKWLSPVDSDNPLGDLYGWECLETPGHSPGHLSFYRGSDGILLAGDAVTTMNLDNMLTMVSRHPEVCRPPAPATTDWGQAKNSVERLAALKPDVIAPGHGKPMAGASEQLQQLASHFQPPAHGRYVAEPARADETGVTYLPPAPFDRTPRVALGLAFASMLAAAGLTFVRKRQD